MFFDEKDKHEARKLAGLMPVQNLDTGRRAPFAAGDQFGACLDVNGADDMERAIERLIEDAIQHLPAGARFEIRRKAPGTGTDGVCWLRNARGGGFNNVDSIPDDEWNDTRLPIEVPDSGGVLILKRLPRSMTQPAVTMATRLADESGDGRP